MKTSGFKFNKKINKAIFYTLLVFSIINLTSFPTTHSKYFDESKDAILYTSKFYNITKKDLKVGIIDSKKSYFFASFDFKRNDIGVSEGVSDTYTIIIPSGCIFSGLPKNYIDNGTSATVTFTSPSTSSRAINIRCTLATLQGDQPDTEKIAIPVKITEQVGNEPEFLYNSTNGVIETTYQEYKDSFPDAPAGSVISSDKKELTIYKNILPESVTMISVFNSWLEEYMAEYGDYDYITEVKEYVSKKYKTDADLMELDENSVPVSKLKGIKVEYDAINNEYTFIAEDNLEGYAKTAIFNPHIENPDWVSLFFSIKNTIDNQNEIDSIFAYYLSEYVYKNDDAKVKEVLDYINLLSNNVGITYIMDGKHNINGLDYWTPDIDIYSAKLLYDYAHQVANSQIRLTFNDISNMAEGTKTLLQNSNTVSEYMFNKLTEITNNGSEITYIHPVMNSMLQNNTSIATKKEFNNYYIEPDIIYDKSDPDNPKAIVSKYVMVRTFSFGESYNYMTVGEIASTLTANHPNLDITFTNASGNSNGLTIKVLDKLIVDDSMFVTSEVDGTTTISEELVTNRENTMKNSLLAISEGINTFLKSNNEEVDASDISDIEVVYKRVKEDNTEEIISDISSLQLGDELIYTLEYSFGKK